MSFINKNTFILDYHLQIFNCVDLDQRTAFSKRCLSLIKIYIVFWKLQISYISPVLKVIWLLVIFKSIVHANVTNEEKVMRICNSL